MSSSNALFWVRIYYAYFTPRKFSVQKTIVITAQSVGSLLAQAAKRLLAQAAGAMVSIGGDTFY